MTEIKDNKELLIHAGEGTQGRKSMVSINIQDGTELIKLACEDLQAIQTVISMSENHPVYANDHEALIVARRALSPIISDIEEGVGNIDMALMEARDEEDGRGDSENSYIKTCKLISEVKEKGYSAHYKTVFCIFGKSWRGSIYKSKRLFAGRKTM